MLSKAAEERLSRKKVRQVIPSDIDCATEPSASAVDIAAYLGVRTAGDKDWYLRDGCAVNSAWRARARVRMASAERTRAHAYA